MRTFDLTNDLINALNSVVRTLPDIFLEFDDISVEAQDDLGFFDIVADGDLVIGEIVIDDALQAHIELFEAD